MSGRDNARCFFVPKERPFLVTSPEPGAATGQPGKIEQSMALQHLTDEQVQTWSRAQKDEWGFKKVFRGDMGQL